jgi:hypothetical protein
MRADEARLALVEAGYGCVALEREGTGWRVVPSGPLLRCRKEVADFPVQGEIDADVALSLGKADRVTVRVSRSAG